MSREVQGTLALCRRRMSGLFTRPSSDDSHFVTRANESGNTKDRTWRVNGRKRRKTGEFNPTVPRGGIKTPRSHALGYNFRWINQLKSAHCEDSKVSIVRSSSIFWRTRRDSFAPKFEQEPIYCFFLELITFKLTRKNDFVEVARNLARYRFKNNFVGSK